MSAVSVETARFDTQALQNPEVSGVEYQQGELFGCEVREYLLEKWGRRCAYCGRRDVSLEVEHLLPKSRGGSDRVSNLTLSCRPCNQAKGNWTVEEFGKAIGKDFSSIARHAKEPLKDAAAVNTTRWAVFRGLKATGLPVEVGTGGRTRWNRTRLGIPKRHALDAACVGAVDGVEGWDIPVLGIQAAGRGAYQRTRVTAHGFPRGYLTRCKQVSGFQTGDRVKAVVPQGKKAGVHIGRVAVRASGSFNLQTSSGTIQGISWKYCHLLHRGDGYGYRAGKRISSPPVNGRGLRARVL